MFAQTNYKFLKFMNVTAEQLVSKFWSGTMNDLEKKLLIDLIEKDQKSNTFSSFIDFKLSSTDNQLSEHKAQEILFKIKQKLK